MEQRDLMPRIARVEGKGDANQLGDRLGPAAFVQLRGTTLVIGFEGEDGQEPQRLSRMCLATHVIARLSRETPCDGRAPTVVTQQSASCGAEAQSGVGRHGHDAIEIGAIDIGHQLQRIIAERLVSRGDETRRQRRLAATGGAHEGDTTPRNPYGTAVNDGLPQLSERSGHDLIDDQMPEKSR